MTGRGGDPTPGRRGVPAIAIVSVALGLALVVIYVFRAVFLPLLLALALAYIFEPLVQWLVRRRMSRLAAVSAIMACFVAVLVGTVGWLTLETVAFVDAITGDATRNEEGKLVQGVQRFFHMIHEQFATPGWTDAWLERLKDQDWGSYTDEARALLKGMFQRLWGSVELLMIATLMPVYLFYLMLDLERVWGCLTRHLPAHHRDHTLRVFAQLHEGMAAFLRGRVIISVLKGALTSIGLVFCGTPMAVVVGFTAGLLSVIPFVGPALGFVIAAALTLADDMSVSALAWVILLFVVVEVIENFVLTPAVMQKGADLHPLTIIFCVVFWGTALGAFGALVAIPLTLVVKVLLQEYVLPSVRELADLPGEGAAEA